MCIFVYNTHQKYVKTHVLMHDLALWYSIKGFKSLLLRQEPPANKPFAGGSVFLDYPKDGKRKEEKMDLNAWMEEYRAAVEAAFGSRVVCLGLQGEKVERLGEIGRSTVS